MWGRMMGGRNVSLSRLGVNMYAVVGETLGAEEFGNFFKGKVSFIPSLGLKHIYILHLCDIPGNLPGS